MTKIIQRHDTAANWTSVNPTLSQGEFGVETDTGKFKIGDGQKAWTNLPYASSGGAGGSGTQITSADGSVEYGELALGDTLAVENGVLNANLDEIGNEVNTLAGRVTSIESEVTKKQDKLTTKTPIKIDVVPDERLVGFEVDTLNNQIRATSNQAQTMSFGSYQDQSINVANAKAYIKIPYTLGQILRLPFKPTQTYTTSPSSLGTAMLPGWYGHTNEDGTVSPVLTACMRSSRSTSVNSDTPYSYYYYNFGDNVNGVYKSNSSGRGDQFPNAITGSADTPVLCTAVTFDSNNNKLILDMQFPRDGYNNPDYSTYWTDGCEYTPPTNYQGIDCFIYCPPGQEYINQNLFGLFNPEYRLGPGMLDFTKTANNLFSFEGADIQYLQLDIGDGLSVVDGKLTATSGGGTTPENMVTTDTEQKITGSKYFSNGLKVGGYAGISDHNGEKFIYIDPVNSGWTIGTNSSYGPSDVYIKRGPDGNHINIDSGNISEYVNYTFQASGTGMPSNRYTDLTLGASGSKYTAPDNGWFNISKITGSSTHTYLDLKNETSSNLVMRSNSYGSASTMSAIYLPAKKGDIVKCSYNLTGETLRFKFIYAKGTKNEET